MVDVVARDPATLVAPTGPPVRCTAELAPVRTTALDDDRLLVDFGQNLVGRVRIKVAGPAGHTVVIRHAEVLQELGTSAEAEIAPHTIELENQTVRLTGTVEAQYTELRRILRQIYYKELGLTAPEAAAEVAKENTPDQTQPASVEPVAGS